MNSHGFNHTKGYGQVYANQMKFEKFLSKICNEDDDVKKLRLAKYAAHFATFECTGYFRSSVLEEAFLDIAKKYDLNSYDISYQKNSFLHVMTQAYNAGGHTRVVERWITQSPVTDKQSIVLLKQGDVPYPTENLQKITEEHNGELILFDEGETDIERFLHLRRLGLEYEYIVLHTHMDDPTALMAFGTNKFTRPVILFNHADHMFWLGLSIADIIADIRTTTSISKTCRRANNLFMLGIPADSNSPNEIVSCDTYELKNNLHIPINSKVIVTSGSAHKYMEFNGVSLSKLLVKIVNSIENIYCIVIGPDKSEKQWRNAYEVSNGKVDAIGSIGYANGYLDHINCADVVVDSWPMGGGTALIDAISLNKPILSLKSPQGQLDYIVNSEGYCDDENIFIEKLITIINDEKYAKNLKSKIEAGFIQDHSLSAWSHKLQKLIELTPKEHRIRKLSHADDSHVIDEMVVLNYYIYHENIISRLRNQLLKLKFFNKCKRYLQLKLPKTYNLLSRVL